MAVFILVSVNWLWGYTRLQGGTESEVPIRVAVLQGNIPQDVKWDRAYREDTLANYEELVIAAAGQGAQLIVWPEAAVPFYFQSETTLRNRLTDTAGKYGRPMLLGAPAFEVIEQKIAKRNRAYYLGEQGDLRGHYDKIHLVPFGEYVPFGNILTFAGKLVQEVGDFTPGDEYRLFDLQGRKFGTVICYEIIFPGLVRRFAKAGASFMTNITNDAWYGRTSASHQHFTQMVFRAVENNLPIARAANTGILGFVDARGRIMFTSGLFERGSYTRDLHPRRNRTFYTRHGDVFALLCLALFTGWAILAMTDRVRII